MPYELNDKAMNNLKKNAAAWGKLAYPETDAILAAAKSYIEADVAVKPGANTYKLGKTEGSFARVMVGSGEGGYYAVLKKVYSLWVVVATGQDLPGKEAGKKYGLPEGWFSAE